MVQIMEVARYLWYAMSYRSRETCKQQQHPLAYLTLTQCSPLRNRLSWRVQRSYYLKQPEPAHVLASHQVALYLFSRLALHMWCAEYSRTAMCVQETLTISMRLCSFTCNVWLSPTHCESRLSVNKTMSYHLSENILAESAAGLFIPKN